jgi:hypothetical protein
LQISGENQLLEYPCSWQCCWSEFIGRLRNCCVVPDTAPGQR